MADIWTNWRHFPDGRSGELLQAPIGPGVYEVRHALSGRLIAFGHAANVANALCGLVAPGSRPFWRRLTRRPIALRSADLEYRTCATTSRREARNFVWRLQQCRQVLFRRRWRPLWA